MTPDTDSRKALVEAAFAVAADSTRHVWDTPEEDAAWVHLQTIAPTGPTSQNSLALSGRGSCRALR